MNWRGILLLESEDQSACLKIDNGKVSVVAQSESEHTIKGGFALARLVIGSDDPDEIIRQDHIACSGDAAELASVLFPNLHPVMSHFDEY